MTVAMLDRAVPYTSLMHDWVQGSPQHFQDRLVLIGSPDGDYNPSHSHLPATPYLYPPSIHSSSSMAPMRRQPCASTASNHPPSLTSCHTRTDTSTDSSVCTGVADQILGFSLLEEVGGVLVQPFSEVEAPVYECVFWFLNCHYLTQDRNEWKTHCLSHFHGEDPPRSVMCPLCGWETSRSHGSEAWGLRMHHLADGHFAFGQNLRTSRPDFHLFHHLWQKRLIGDQDLKELKGGNHNLTHAPSNFVTTQGRGPLRERNGRGVGRQRLQHVPEGQTRRR
ncbi:hypothetical protein ST47_g9663 [Ascochyta rabiei]|uniref:Uncharacterized protein n=2 Tax=Didymella rabiei TaxID=5454 RepID=A0A162WTB0_DIDRA|nr:hypothetical protein ST47_g9663 [Ascochyta rabiei]